VGYAAIDLMPSAMHGRNNESVPLSVQEPSSYAI